MSESAQAVALEATAPAGRSNSVDVAAIVRNVAHELRQPLSTIESVAYYLEILLPPEESKPRAQVEKLHELVSQISRILSDAVHFLRATPPQPELLELEEEIGLVLADLPSEEGLATELRLAGGLPHLRADVEQVRHLLRGLLSFCHHVGRRGAPTTVATSVVEGQVRLQVSVPLAGVNVGDPESFFVPFGPRAPAGFGLSLASAREIAEAHGGRIDVQAAPERLTLTVVFPAA